MNYYDLCDKTKLCGSKSQSSPTNICYICKMIWKQLEKIALLGTERSTLTPAMQEALIDKGINTDQEITKTVLEAVAYYAPLQKAGWQPKVWKAPY